MKKYGFLKQWTQQEDKPRKMDPGKKWSSQPIGSDVDWQDFGSIL